MRNNWNVGNVADVQCSSRAFPIKGKEPNAFLVLSSPTFPLMVPWLVKKKAEAFISSTEF